MTNKFRIFVDGSYDPDYNIGTIAYHIQDTINYGNKVIKMNIHNNVFATKLFRCKNSFDAELSAIALGLDTLKRFILINPVLKKVPVRIKSDNITLIKYITKEQIKVGCEDYFDGIDLDYLEDVKQRYKELKFIYPNFKLSYIPSKKNLAHNNAFEMLRLERGLVNWLKK